MKPETRNEQFLAAAAGEYEGDLPTPVTREEQYLAKIAEGGGSGGGGTSNYNQLSNKPSINNVSLQGNKSLSDLGLYSKSEVDALVSGGGGNVIETEIEFVEETYEEDGEEYTELVIKFTNEEAILDAIYGENRDELNSPTIAIKYRVLYDPLEFSPEKPPDNVWKDMADEFTEYYHCTSCYYIDPSEGVTNYYAFLTGKRGDFYINLIDDATSTNAFCTSIQTIVSIDVVVDENLKPCGMSIRSVYGAVFFSRYSLSNENRYFVYPAIAIDEFCSKNYIYSTEEYEYSVNIDYQMLSGDYFLNYLPSGFSTTNSKLSVYSSCVYKIMLGCNVTYSIQLVINEEESFSDGELLVGLIYDTYTNDTITILGYGFNNNMFAGYVDLVLEPNGEIYTRQSISGIDTLRFSVSYPIDPFDMPYLW